MDWQDILANQFSEGSRLTTDEAVILYRDAPLHELRSAANSRRVKMNGDREVTYLIDRNINYTNVCTINCQFCSFYRPPGHDETYTQTIDEISNRVRELENIEGTRILMQGGVNPELGIEYYTELLSSLRSRHPTIDIDCFSPIEIEGIAEVTGISTLEVLTHLKEAGMHGLPGGGAEMLVESVRTDVSPKKGSPDNWLNVMREAQSLGLVTSATNVFGFGESIENRVEHMFRIRELQDYSLENYSMDLPRLLHGLFNWKTTHTEKGIVEEISSSWVLDLQNIFATLLSQDSSSIISNTYKHHGLPWDYP